ncbi:hypothetical protein PVM12_19920 [Enterobacter soli]|uniref:hypothetical protein n=1 Tax=Enterobacter soli TaxID=885040 RepID=UPI002379B16E|nr:hypothetical protein [Enterobacter soli]MDD9246280.1 hypothetical protein [Enterobacter soli]
MHITLKNILKLIRPVAIISIPFHALSNKDSLITQHTIIHKTPPVTFGTDISSPYYFSDIEKNDIKRSTDKVYVTLSVKQIQHHVSATIKFINMDKINYFIHRRLLPIHPDTNDPYFFSPLCQDAFFILMEGVHLKFLPRATNICEYIEDDDNDDLYIDRNDNNDKTPEWMKLPSGKSISFNVNINNAYSFAPGKHLYKIKSLRYRIANDKWFSQRAINKSFFSIINFHFPSCQKHNESFYIQKLSRLCKNDYSAQEKSIANFMHTFFPGGGKNKNHFDISSNQVQVAINGYKIKSYHDTKIELLKKRYKEDWGKYWF